MDVMAWRLSRLQRGATMDMILFVLVGIFVADVICTWNERRNRHE